MIPATTTAFNLPEHLVAKANPALIAGDEQHLAAIAECMEQQIADLSERLATQPAPRGTGRKAMDRDLEIHRLTARLRLLRRYGLDLCLGRMVYAHSPEPVYIGRLGLTDSAGRRLLIDWRTPAAEPFFAATRANPMGLTSRRRYRWSRGRISDYWDEVFSPDGLEGHARRSTTNPPSSPASAAAARPECETCSAPSRPTRTPSSARAPAVRSSLRAVRGPGRPSSLCIALPISSIPTRLGDGGGGVLFVGPHRPYLAYIADVLPSLGEEGVQTCTLRDLVTEGAAAAVETDPDVARLKSSAEMVTAIEPAVRLYEEPPLRA